MSSSSIIDIKHLLIRSILFVGLTYILMRYVMVFAIWSYVGDGVYPKSWDFYINIIYGLSAIILLLPILIYRIIANYKKRCMSKVNDYLIVCGAVIITTILIYHSDYN